MSYLEDPRVLFAAERTLLAWNRTSAAIMGFGFVVERFELFLRVMAGEPVALEHRGFSFWIGVTLLVCGSGAAIVSALQFKHTLRSLGPEEIPRGYALWTGPLLNYALAATGLVLAIHFVFSNG